MSVRTLVPLACALLALASAAPASAARHAPSDLTLTAASDHFVVHYGRGATEADAQQALAAGEAAYAVYVSTWGYPAPADDGDGRTDVYLAPGITSGAFTQADTGALSSPASITMDSEIARDNPYLLAHEYFHAIQMGIYQYSAAWVVEGSAEWAGGEVTDPGNSGFGISAGSLDCRPAGCDNASARSRSGFFQYASNRFGPRFVADVLQRAHDRAVASSHALPYDVESVEDVLAAHGTSLAAAFADYAAAAAPAALPDATLTTGVRSGALPDQAVTVPHLGARYFAIRAPYGPGDLVHACAAGTLTVAVQIAGGQSGTPALSVDGGAAAPLAQSGDTASATVPWSTCGKSAVVALPNSSVTQDGLSYTMRASTAIGPVPVPALKLRFPSRLRAARSGIVSLPLTASAPGRVEVTLRSRTVRKTFKLLKGPNTLRLKLPRSVRAGKHRLTLVPISQAGKRGKAIVRKVRLVR